MGSAEATTILDIHRATLIRWVEQGKLRAVHKLPSVNGAYLFDRSEVEALAERLRADRGAA